MKHMANLDITFLETDQPGIIRMVVMETTLGVKTVRDIVEGTPREVLIKQIELMELDKQLTIRKK